MTTHKDLKVRLLFGSCSFGGGVGVFFGEAFYAARGVHELLLASEERMAIGANLDTKHVALDGRARGKSISTSAVYGDRVIVGMNTGFHETPFCRGRSAPHPAVAGDTAASLGRVQLLIIPRAG